MGAYGRKKTQEQDLNPKQKKTVKNMIKHDKELKHFDGWISATRDFSGTISDFSLIPQGDTSKTRDGDVVKLEAMELRGSVVVGDATNVCRIIVFQWYESTSPVPSDILQVAYVGTAEAVYAPYNYNQSKIYRILKDRTFNLSGVSMPVKNYSLKIKRFGRKNIKFDFSATTGSNKIYVLCISDSGTVSHPTFNVVSRISYTDS